MTIRPVVARPFLTAVPKPSAAEAVLKPASPLCPAVVARRYEARMGIVAAAQREANTEVGQVKSLATLRAVGLLDEAAYQDRYHSLRARWREHAADTSLEERGGFGVANQFWKIVHPARLVWSAAWNRWEGGTTLGSYLEFLQSVRTDRWRPETVTFYTDDNVQLTGYVVRAAQRRRDQPVLLMVSGNSSCAEGEYPLAAAHAQRFGVAVLVYNSRGVGLSLGDVTHPEQSLLDCKAAIRHATTLGRRVGVWGCSLGGALCAETLRRLREAKDPIMDQLEMFTCVNSFPNLPAIMASLLGGPWPGASRAAASPVLRWMDINPLNTRATVAAGTLGLPVAVFNSSHDELMHDGANLAVALREETHLPPSVQVFDVSAGGHNYYERFLEQPQYVQRLCAWARPSQHLASPGVSAWAVARAV